MTERQPSEALEKLNQGIEESRKTMQRQTMGLTQEYFSDSVERLKQQMGESRSALEGLPDQLPGGREESFQMFFQELMNSYSRIEDCLDEAQREVAGLDTESFRRQGVQGEVEASDAALREARELGVDPTQVEGAGSGGRVVAENVRSDEERQTGHPEATDAARREAKKRGIDLSEVEATGVEGQIIVSDVVEFAAKRGHAELEDTEAKSAEAEGSSGTSEASGTVEAVAERPSSAVDRVGETANGQVNQAEETASEATQEAARVTSAARRKAQELGVDLSGIQGSGAGGLVTLRDVVGNSR